MNHTRHMDIFRFPQTFSMTLIGAGGIGAITAITLAKMGIPRLVVYDDDKVENENLPGQMHQLSGIGKWKVEALEETVANFADDTSFCGIAGRVAEETRLPKSTVIVSAVDSIEARKQIWEAVFSAGLETKVIAYIDARMAAEQYQHFAVDMQSTLSTMKYWEMLSSTNEEDIEELPCTAKATFYTAAFAAGHIATVVRNILKHEFNPHRLIHYIPQSNIITLPL